MRLKSHGQIGREIGIARTTVARVLSQPQVTALLASYRDQVLDLVPEAIAVCKRNLRRKRGASWQLAVEILKGYPSPDYETADRSPPPFRRV